MTHTILDTGPLVAALNRRDRHHEWAKQTFCSVQPPMFTCEAVLAEACYLVGDLAGGSDAVLLFVERGLLEVNFAIAAELDPVRGLMNRYRDVPMSLADACIVRMTELEGRSTVLTLDSDFQVYRRNRRHVIPTITPD